MGKSEGRPQPNPYISAKHDLGRRLQPVKAKTPAPPEILPLGPEFPVGPESLPSGVGVSAPSRVSLIYKGRAGVFLQISPSTPDSILHSDAPNCYRAALGCPCCSQGFPLSCFDSHGGSPIRDFLHRADSLMLPGDASNPILGFTLFVVV